MSVLIGVTKFIVMLKHTNLITCLHQQGLHVIAIEGHTTNLAFNTKVTVNTVDNQAVVTYTITTYADGGHKAHIFACVRGEYSKYSDALHHYNKVLEQYGKK